VNPGKNDMDETNNWPGFYAALCQHGPDLLVGIDDETREMIVESASTTDIFWSDGLQERLVDGAADDDLRAGVLSALELWRENVLETLEADFAIELDWQTVNIDAASSLIDELVEAATPE